MAAPPHPIAQIVDGELYDELEGGVAYEASTGRDVVVGWVHGLRRNGYGGGMRGPHGLAFLPFVHVRVVFLRRVRSGRYDGEQRVFVRLEAIHLHDG
jgi:hypothetical protein